MRYDEISKECTRASTSSKSMQSVESGTNILGRERGLSDGIVASAGGKGGKGATSGRGHGGPGGDEGREAEHCDGGTMERSGR